ncbi:MAG: substrate-binding domain-containing protein [Nocardioidaceae bacterium]
MTGSEVMTRLLTLTEPPDAVFCYSDLLAFGAMRTVLSRGLRVPEDIAIVGFDGTEGGIYSTPTLSTVAPDKEEIAQLAVDTLLDRLDTGGAADRPPVQVPASYRLEVRESSAAAPSVPPLAATPSDHEGLS